MSEVRLHLGDCLEFMRAMPDKSVDVMNWLVDRCSMDGDTIFDPFMGSGTTGAACVQNGRNFIGCEIDPKYFAIAQKRIADAQLQTRMDI